MINFVYHRTNYCKIVLAKTKDVAAQKLRQFMAYFERRFSCRIRVLKTDGGGEHLALNLFCKEGIAQQISEPRNQAIYEKEEKIHRTIVNMVWNLIFACDLPLMFWETLLNMLGTI